MDIGKDLKGFKSLCPLDGGCSSAVRVITRSTKHIIHIIRRQEAKQFYAARFEECKGLMPP